jgi:octaprenyl-diphosphate synthase
MNIGEIRDLVVDDMQAIDQVILQRLRSDVVLINQIGQYIVSSGGKRLRPMLVSLAARACGYRGERHRELAAVIEFIHTATLLHDDVVDSSELRRNRDTANAVWGNEASVLVGDFLYSRSFEMMVDVGLMRVMEILAHATNRIAEGEVLQLLNCNDPDTSEEKYMEVIRRKTATLFEAGARLGAVLAAADDKPDREPALGDYGLHLGIAFQLVDDALDYSSSNAELGKNVGDDLAEGKPTLPLIRALARGTPEQQTLIRQAITGGGREHIGPILQAIESTDAIAYTIALARSHAQRAREAVRALPETPYTHALQGLADFTVQRTY